MIVLRDHFVDAYHVIRQDSCHMSPVVVFVAPDCDSVCACHMLTTLFRMDNVPYKVRPIANYEEMKSSCRASFSKRQDEDVQNVVLLNCGGSVNLTSFLELQENVILYVIDSHRPYHLANVSSENLQVRIIDESNEHNEYPSDDEIEEFSEEGETIEGWSPDEYSQKKRRKTSRSLREAKQQLIADYYQGSYFGQAASMILYSLAQQLSRDDNMLLWCAIVGLTDQFVHSRTQIDRYNEHVVELRHEVLSKNENSNQSDEPGSIDKGSPVINPGQVMFEANELIFFHYRHIALLDSIYHSKYVASRLGVWKDQGSKKLRTFLARMGIPLRECSLSYMVMKTLYKDSLREKLEIYSSEYGLDIDDLVFASFSRVSLCMFSKAKK